MSTTIWKWELKVVDEQVLHLPLGFVPLTVQIQGETPCLWALVSPVAMREPVKLYTYGTGHPMPTDREETYLGSYQLRGGALVFHVFAQGKVRCPT